MLELGREAGFPNFAADKAPRQATTGFHMPLAPSLPSGGVGAVKWPNRGFYFRSPLGLTTTPVCGIDWP